MKRSTRFLPIAILAAGAACVDAGPADAPAPGMPADPGTSDCLAELAAGRNVIPGRFIVAFRGAAVSPTTVDRDAAVGSILGPRRSVFHIPVANAVALDLSPAEVGQLRADPRVAYVEPDGLVCALDNGDASTESRRPAPATCASGAVETIPSGLTEIGWATRAHSGAGVIVAVVDTGIDLDHPDLAENVLVGLSTGFVDNVTGDDNEGHGTHVAGTIAALADNGLGVAGVAPGASLMAVKVLNRKGSGSWSQVAAGIDWAVANGADVINLSLGGTQDSQTLRTSIDNAFAAGVFVAVAAGNESMSATRSYPAAYDGSVITVSAEDPANDGFPSWSNYGVPPVDLAAPGVNICSTVPGSYGLKSGTSMATPHVAGAAALYLEGAPGAAPFDVRDALVAGTSPLADTALHTEDLLNASGL